ncbi:MAG: ATP12 family protein [Pseudomonadota bacterium]
MKRFFKTAGVRQETEGFAVTLDGKTVRTPFGTAVVLVSRPLAEAIAEEWESQEAEIQPHRMPLMRLAAITLDHVAAARETVVAEVVKYVTTDLLCYRVAEPLELAERQLAVWQPLLDWVAGRFDAPLAVTTDIVALDQPAASLAALEAAVSGMNNLRLTALRESTAICGSLVLGLALLEAKIDAETAWQISQLDETFQIEKWGRVPEAEARRNDLRENLAAAERFLVLGNDSLAPLSGS